MSRTSFSVSCLKMSLFQPKKRKRWFDKLTINKNEKKINITTIIIIALKTSGKMFEKSGHHDGEKRSVF